MMMFKSCYQQQNSAENCNKTKNLNGHFPINFFSMTNTYANEKHEIFEAFKSVCDVVPLTMFMLSFHSKILLYFKLTF